MVHSTFLLLPKFMMLLFGAHRIWAVGKKPKSSAGRISPVGFAKKVCTLCSVLFLGVLSLAHIAFVDGSSLLHSRVVMPQSLVVLLVVCFVVELVLRVVSSGLPGYVFLSSTTSLAAASAALLLVVTEEHRVRRTSPVLTVYWVGLLMGGIFKVSVFRIFTIVPNLFLFLFLCSFALRFSWAPPRSLSLFCIALNMAS